MFLGCGSPSGSTGQEKTGLKRTGDKSREGPSHGERGCTVRTRACAPGSHDGAGGGFAAVGENPPTESGVSTERSVVAALAWPRSMAAWKGERWTGRGRLSGSGSGGGGLLYARCLCFPLRDHAPPGCHLRAVSGLSSKPGRLVQSWGQVGSCRPRVDVGKRRKPGLRFIPKGTRELSSCHQNTVLS